MQSRATSAMLLCKKGHEPSDDALKDIVRDTIHQYLSYQEEWEQKQIDYTVRRGPRSDKFEDDLSVALRALAGAFVVADLETTGLGDDDEIVEIAAARFSADGTRVAEFCKLVRSNKLISPGAARVNGITETELDSHGVDPRIAIPEFIEFVGKLPVFFHNASFDLKYISRATALHGLKFENSVHDSLTLARAAWPRLSSYRLGELARMIGCEAAVHRAGADVRATGEVILAARRIIEKS